MRLKCACKAQDELHMGQGRCEDLAQETMLVNTRLGFYFRLCILGPVEQGFLWAMGLRGNWALEVILDQKGELDRMGQDQCVYSRKAQKLIKIALQG